MTTKLTRTEVYDLIDGERAYQDRRWGAERMVGPKEPHDHSPQEWLTYMRDYIEEALHIGCREEDAVAFTKQLAIIRKVTALGVVAMENHGAPPRQ